MGYRVIASPLVEEDLDDAITYIQRRLGSPKAASGLLESYRETLVTLRETPLIHPIDEDLARRLHLPLRKCRVRGYNLYYSVDQGQKTIAIYAFIHSSRDIAGALGQRL